MALAHERSGSGAPLVLVHGLGHNRGAWDPVRDALADERDVVAVDMPGFGESAPLPDGTRATVEAIADAVAATVAELGIENPHVAGNSLGGAVALELGPPRRGALGHGHLPRRLLVQPARGDLLRGVGDPDARRHTGARSAMPFLASTGLGRTLLIAQVFGRPGACRRRRSCATRA